MEKHVQVNQRQKQKSTSSSCHTDTLINQDQVISSDLTAITLKDLNELLKALNLALDKENQLSLSGKKQDIVDRLTEYFLSELEKKDQTSIKGAVAIVNRVARKK
jgi:hypothetical protein